MPTQRLPVVGHNWGVPERSTLLFWPLVLSLLNDTDGANFLPPQGIRMSVFYNQTNWVFLVQVASPAGRHIEFMRIEQLVNMGDRVRSLQRVENQVQEHLDGLHRKTGWSYFVIASGTPEQVDRISPPDDDIPL